MEPGQRYTLKEVAAFLEGTAPLDGFYFGGGHPTEPGAFWWRKYLRAAVEAASVPALPEDVAALVERLEGIYRVPITDGLGAVGGGEEPDNPTEFVRRLPPVPIQLEAASALKAQAAECAKLQETIDGLYRHAMEMQARAEAAEAKVKAQAGEIERLTDGRDMMGNWWAREKERAEAAETKLREANDYWQQQVEGGEAEKRRMRDERDAEMVARTSAEAKLREAVEVMRPFAKAFETPTEPVAVFGDFRRARAFLSTMESDNGHQ
jgi:hypothetical protein